MTRSAEALLRRSNKVGAIKEIVRILNGMGYHREGGQVGALAQSHGQMRDKLEEALKNTVTWRDPTHDDNGEELYIRHEELIHADFNPMGRAVGTVFCPGEDDEPFVVVALWNDEQEEYWNKELGMPFKVCKLP